MSNFLVRDIDEDLMRRLKERARRNGRSLQQEFHAAIAAAARPTADEVRTIFEDFDASHQSIPADVDIVAILREERDGSGWK